VGAWGKRIPLPARNLCPNCGCVASPALQDALGAYLPHLSHSLVRGLETATHGERGVHRQRFGVNPPALGRVGDDCSFLTWGHASPGYNMPPHSGLGCMGPEWIFNWATAMKPQEMSSATNENRSDSLSSRLYLQWSDCRQVLTQGTSEKSETDSDPAKPPTGKPGTFGFQFVERLHRSSVQSFIACQGEGSNGTTPTAERTRC
jgi:hypothetical protein